MSLLELERGAYRARAQACVRGQSAWAHLGRGRGAFGAAGSLGPVDHEARRLDLSKDAVSLLVRPLARASDRRSRVRAGS